MIRLNSDVRVYLATTPVDGRKAINGLSALVIEEFEATLMDGSVFVFYNRARDRVKCLFWEKNGFVLYQKRLEHGKFKIKRAEDGLFVMTQQQLDWLLAGLDFALMSEFPDLDFEHIF
jgi:transposase